jgi:hypothetical protein
VEAAVEVAVKQISSLVNRILDGTWEKQNTQGPFTTAAKAKEA